MVCAVTAFDINGSSDFNHVLLREVESDFVVAVVGIHDFPKREVLLGFFDIQVDFAASRFGQMQRHLIVTVVWIDNFPKREVLLSFFDVEVDFGAVAFRSLKAAWTLKATGTGFSLRSL
jgi:hypothetical protein